MSLQDLGNLGEFVAAVAVLVTLIYLALQIRQNTRQIVQNTQSLRLAANHAFKRDGQDLRMTIAQDPEMARILRVGLADRSSLDENDYMRFNVMLAAIFEHLQFAFERREEGLVDWDAQERFTRTYMAQPGARDWWNSGREILNEPFVDHVEKRLLPASKGSRPYWLPTPAAGQDDEADRP
jgi:hypothetical protein